MEVGWRWRRTEDVVGCPCCDGFAYETIPNHRLNFKKIYRCPLGHTFYCYLVDVPGFTQNMVTLRYEKRIGLMVTKASPTHGAFSKLTSEEQQKILKDLREPCFTPAKMERFAAKERNEWSLTGRNYPCPQCGERCHEVYCFVRASFPAGYTFRCKNGHKWSETERWEEANWKREYLYAEPPEGWQYIWPEADDE